MNGIVRTVSVKNVVVILALAGVLAIAGYTAQALLTSQADFGLEVETGSQAEAGVAVESEAATVEDVSYPSRAWSPEEIGTGSPAIVVGESAFAAGEDYMSVGRYLERERALEGASAAEGQLTARAFILQKLAATEADDAPFVAVEPDGGCEFDSAGGAQPC